MVANVYLSGLARTRATNSRRFDAGTLGCAVTSSGTEPMFATGVKSRCTSYGTFFRKSGLMTKIDACTSNA